MDPFVLTALLSVASPKPCPHPYFPMEAGLELTYRASGREVQVRIDKVETRSDGSAQAQLELKVDGKLTRTLASCDAQGVTSPLGGLEGVAIPSEGRDLRVISAEGLLLPAELSLGASWHNKLALQISPQLKVLGALQPVLAQNLERDHQVVASERLSISAGHFEGLKVRTLSTATIKGQSDGRSAETSSWWVQGLGVVKISAGGVTQLELLSVRRPLASR
jgi:hypothetical protein